MFEEIESTLRIDKSLSHWETCVDGWTFKLKDIETEILIRLYINPVHGGYNFSLSHFIHTPTQATPYVPSRPWGDNLDYAFQQGLLAITSYYREAVEQGYSPSTAWLKPNKFGT